MKPFRTSVVACAITSAWALAQTDYTASLSTAPAAKPAGSGESKVGPRTGLYGAVMKGNAAADNTVDDLTKRPHLIDQQYLAGWGGADLVSGAYNFEALGFNWFGAAYGGGDPDEVRFGLAESGKFGGGLMVSLAKTSTEDSLVGGVTKTKTVLESDGFGAFGSFALGNAGDVYGDIAVYTGFDNLAAGNENYTLLEPPAGGNTEVTPRIIHLLAGWKRDASAEGTHSLNAEFILDIHNWENKTPATTLESKITDIQLWFYHGYILKDAGTFKVFGGSNSQLRYADISWQSAPVDRSILSLAISPNMSFQKTLGKGFEGFAGAGFTLLWASEKNIPQAGGAIPDKSSTLATVGADMALGLRWVYENLAVEGSLKDAVLANGPDFIGGTANQGLFGQIGLSVGF